MSRYGGMDFGMAGHGAARPGKAAHGMDFGWARRGSAWQGSPMAWIEAGKGMAGPGAAGRGLARQLKAWEIYQTLIFNFNILRRVF